MSENPLFYSTREGYNNILPDQDNLRLLQPEHHRLETTSGKADQTAKQTFPSAPICPTSRQ
jgi:hypothetical protein